MLGGKYSALYSNAVFMTYHLNIQELITTGNLKSFLKAPIYLTENQTHMDASHQKRPKF